MATVVGCVAMPCAGAETLRGLRARCAGLILAGGAASRMGGADKGSLMVGGRTILSRVTAVLRSQTAILALSTRDDAAPQADPALPVLADPVPELGPLGGIFAGLIWAKEQGLDWLLTAPVDTPFLPADLLLRLGLGVRQAPAAIACSGARRHGVVGLWPVRLLPELRRFLLEEGQRKVSAWAASCGAVAVSWPDDPVDPFLNVNTPKDLAAAERLSAPIPPQSGAVVLPRGDTGQALLSDFAEELRRAGVRLGGLLQRGSKSGGDRPEDVTMVALDDGRTFPIMQSLGKSGSCAVDPQGVCAASEVLRRAVAQRLAPVLVNKFGPLEADGLGLADEMLAVMAEGLPLLTTVSEDRLEAWLRFCGGYCELLSDDPASLRRWWRGWQGA